MHLGNASTALLAWLQTRAAGGTMILRMEDLDRARCKPAYSELLIEEMRWLGLDWDEGPDVGGPYGPYTQSERGELYRDAIERLKQDGRLYFCYCSRAELLMMANAPHGLKSEGSPPRCGCRELSEEERRIRAEIKSPSLHFAMPDRAISFADGVAGERTFLSAGDFAVQRADGIVGYQLAVVVDDIAMGITDVFRGWDLLDSTPRQLALFDALGADAPRYAHGPLWLGDDGKRLSKRHGSVALSELRAEGIAAERIVGLIAWATGLIPEPEAMKPSELLPLWSPEHIAQEAIALPAHWMDLLRQQ
ncbi:tRNA glutamyl-Q(34) synthetase GluQRS [Cohnella thailandensis]|uniref:tRNA glutamyl-Q(34) synthetase GluQRS n=2 Tax=Cohnella thailandensis TaxID=557557 RepID=A0A841T773_9BACL|nr:tRNA glutamyl-Q(34) synthetase GluQRS [Cohnella thailandensis]